MKVAHRRDRHIEPQPWRGIIRHPDQHAFFGGRNGLVMARRFFHERRCRQRTADRRGDADLNMSRHVSATRLALECRTPLPGLQPTYSAPHGWMQAPAVSLNSGEMFRGGGNGLLRRCL